jgi:hypothetical protein
VSRAGGLEVVVVCARAAVRVAVRVAACAAVCVCGVRELDGGVRYWQVASGKVTTGACC